ncbi:hypothetical protein G6F57_001638 [Rhizopus arrhizus]|jgi:uncharacterized protein YbjT (DUF2867 family)|uniref:NAD(P)-binding domain-containing protein n=1 Tax=Rhizopus oryzae TaxID=64495 RepID=A0A9P6XJ80_RHIOR|nr:hypothetical protein G6F23_009277 [Rhizopus arrhizus]KAG1429133.1 hypothetical protein G6F58_000213 [Rhizopus delemar]KAG0769182.1 hypothetical protein G6F24_001290 [Rhizopus arrhizus]KAG0797261.1 hypothetical protein G6F21_000660 [Rhizopus arrhizus]KAG0817867.1 hypothetical protein G6F20_002026 [Rhizopus arrhizus]
MIIVTGADQLMGYAIASHLARFQHLRPELRVICENKSRCHAFVKAGIDVQQVDYKHPHQMSKAFHRAEHIILAVGNEPDRVKNAKYVCKVASRSGAQSIILLSHIGAVSRIHPSLQEYHRIEQAVIKSAVPYTILRLDFVQQYFHLWASHSEKTKQFMLPVTEDVEICPIDITDVCKVIEALIMDNSNQFSMFLDDQHEDQVYTLSGPESVNGKQIAQMLADATGYENYKFNQMRPMDLSYYLENLGMDIWFDARLKQEMSKMYHDTFINDEYSKRAFAAPSAKQIQTILDYFDWAQKTSSSVLVPHATMITNLPCKSIQSFFEENANSFKPRV